MDSPFSRFRTRLILRRELNLFNVSASGRPFFLYFDGDAIDIPAAPMSTIILNSDTTNSDTSALATDATVPQIGQIIVHPSYRPDGAIAQIKMISTLHSSS